ncbi:MAG: FAD-dependent oxidoreductase [Nitrospirae bacterium]|nr:FAD-dependent oxidoreductase [Nitrospirota bacterium]
MDRMSETVVPLKHGEKQLAAVIGWDGIQVFDPGIDIVELCYEYALAVEESSCGQCVPCRTGTRVLADIFSRIRAGKGRPGDMDEITSISTAMSDASMCEIGKSSPRVFLYLLERFKDVFTAAIAGTRKDSSGYTYKSIITAPCMQACPIHLDIPKYIEEIKLGRFRESLEVIRQRLPLPGVVGRVCVRPCESSCRRGLVDEPIQIKHLKRFVADYPGDREGQVISRSDSTGVLEQGRGTVPPQPGMCTNNAFKETSVGRGSGFSAQRNNLPLSISLRKPSNHECQVAIVGAGPSGLTCAHVLAGLGYRVTIFEMLSEPGGMAAVGIPDYRLPRSVLRSEIKAIEDEGVEIIYGKALGVHFTLDDLEEQGYKAVFIGMGCHCHKKMGIEGEDAGYYGHVPGVYFLRNINLGLMDAVPKGKKLVVVGGGNVAIDCARIAFRLGFGESHLVYRRSRKEMSADPVEITDAGEEGVKFHFLTAPKKIIGEHGKVTGLECFSMELGEPDASGRRRPVAVKGSEFIINSDVIVAAIGQEGDFSCLCNLPGVKTSERGSVVVDENLMTTRKGVFAGGDCITGPDVLIRACAHGRLAGLKIDRFIATGKIEVLEEEMDEKLLNSFRGFDADEKVKVPGGTLRVPVSHQSPLTRKRDFREVDEGFTSEEAVKEAGRCLRCYRVLMYAYAGNP